VCHERQCVFGDTLRDKGVAGKKAGLQEPPETPGAQPIESNKNENERVVISPCQGC